MQESTQGRAVPIAVILAILGGALLALGSFLAWAEAGGGGTSVTLKGINRSDGFITLVTGIIALISGLMILGGSGRRAFAIVALVAAVIGAAAGLDYALTAKDRVPDEVAEELAGRFGGTAAEVRALLDQAVDAGELRISMGLGPYMVILGGAVGIVGGVLAMHGAGGAPAMPAAEPTMPSMPEPSMLTPPDDAEGGV